MEAGIYFGLSDSDYRNAPGMNYSSIKALLKSRLYYWVTNPHLNPDYEAQEDSEAMKLGRAYHTRILEGKEKFKQLYAPEYIYGGDDALTSNGDLIDALKEAGVKGYSGKNKQQLIDMLLEAAPEYAPRIYEIAKAEYEAQNAECDFLPLVWIKRIELAAQIIEHNPKLNKMFRGGYPEVSIFWHDEEYNSPMKIRVDYLKTQATNDLKSFSNMADKNFTAAMIHEVCNRKYFIQAALYLRGVEEAKKLAEAGNVHGDVDPKWLDAFIHSPPHDFTFVFQEKGIAPVASALTHSRDSMMNASALQIISDVMQDYHYCREAFGKAPWLDDKEPVFAADEDYPMWAWNV